MNIINWIAIGSLAIGALILVVPPVATTIIRWIATTARGES